MTAKDHHDRRGVERLSAVDGTVAIHNSRYGRLIDIGPEGISFRYLVGENDPPVPEGGKVLAPEDNTVDLVSLSHDLYLFDLPVTASADYPLVDPEFPEIRQCRRCLKFGALKPQQTAALEEFIRLAGSSATA